MSSKRCIMIADLDDQSRSVVDQCLPTDHFQIVEFDAEENDLPPTRADLVVFAAQADVQQTEAFCTKLRHQVGQGVPLLACAGRYVFPSIRPLLGNVYQGLIVLPSDADEFRRKLDSLDRGF